MHSVVDGGVDGKGHARSVEMSRTWPTSLKLLQRCTYRLYVRICPWRNRFLIRYHRMGLQFIGGGAMAALADQRSRTASEQVALAGAARPRRRWSLLVGGLLLVLVSAGVFAVVQLSADDRVQVLAVARPVAAGQVLGAEDLRVVQVVPDVSLRLVRASGVDQVLGRTASVPLAEGSLLTESQLGPPSWPKAGQAVVAVALKPGRLPAGLAAGSHVQIVTVAKETTTDTSARRSASLSVAAVVVGVSEAVDGAGTSVVSLLLAQDEAAKVAGAGAELALVLVGR